MVTHHAAFSPELIRAGFSPGMAVAGTTAAAEGGGAVGGDDIGEHAREALRRIELALAHAGARLEDVVRTRMFVTDISRWEEVRRAHAEVFADISPATSRVKSIN